MKLISTKEQGLFLRKKKEVKQPTLVSFFNEAKKFDVSCDFEFRYYNTRTLIQFLNHLFEMYPISGRLPSLKIPTQWMKRILSVSYRYSPLYAWHRNDVHCALNFFLFILFWCVFIRKINFFSLFGFLLLLSSFKKKKTWYLAKVYCYFINRLTVSNCFEHFCKWCYSLQHHLLYIYTWEINLLLNNKWL